MSSYSSSSQDSIYSLPEPRRYALVNPSLAGSPSDFSQASPGLIYVSFLCEARPRHLCSSRLGRHDKRC